ncbi:MAG TPA: MXAN_5187 C-terminal domain-containing protein [Kofleriaceae bacterium]|nr:MXAN_5187 C-terminal domain-containing protein [Kofleriaceae bacterium]
MALGSEVKKQIKAEDLEELLDGLEKLLDRAKMLYEQYFMGIQKVAPMQLHRDIERKVRELTQQQIRNTGLRFRFTTLSQKFGSYNTYWKRTLREIEQGKYIRDLARVKRKADQRGEDLPEELLVKLPKLVQDRIRRDRARMANLASEGQKDVPAEPAQAGPPPAEPPATPKRLDHVISEEEVHHLFGDGDLDIDGLFSAMTALADGEHVAGEAAASGEAPAGQAPADDADQPPATGSAPPSGPLPAGVAAASPRGISVAIPRIAPRGRSLSGPGGFRVPPPPGMSRAGTAPPREDTEGPPQFPQPGARVPPVATRIVTPVSPLPPAPTTALPTARTAPPISARTPPPVPSGKAPPPVPSGRAPLPSVGRTTAPARPAPPLPPGMDDRQCRDLYSRYLKARQLVGEKNDDVTYEKLVSSLGKQAAAIMTEHGARGVEFHVVVRGDKVVLKARPIKSDKPDKPDR